MKPMMIVPPQTFSAGDLQLLRDNGICVVETVEPARVRFVDPLPVVSSRTEMERAAIQLSRKLLNPGTNPWNAATRDQITRMYVDLLVKGTPLNEGPTQEETDQRHYDQAHYDEIARIAREDARAKRKAKKQEKQA